jgi:uncharacterized UBP type Zn finger protein
MLKDTHLRSGEESSDDSSRARQAGSDFVDLSNACGHVTAAMSRRVHRPKAACEDCLKIGGQWVHLRVCLSCAHVGCCDSSPNRHATAHYHASGHPITTSGEADETWSYCYVDDQLLSAE